MNTKIKELLLTIVCLMNASVENKDVLEVMGLIESKVGSSDELWRKFSDSKLRTRGEAIKNLKKLLRN